MIEFELTNPEGNSPSAVVYTPGQDYVMFNGLMWHLEDALPAEAGGWVGCVFVEATTIVFIDGASGEVAHSAKLTAKWLLHKRRVERLRRMLVVGNKKK